MNEEWRIQFEKELVVKKAKIASLMEEDLLDDDGYPTEDALEIVKLWHWDDIKGWFEFINSIWHLRSWGWSEGYEDHDYENDKKVYRYHISTAGWSGNESIIHAMEENGMLWAVTWVESRRGGHYIFECEELE